MAHAYMQFIGNDFLSYFRRPKLDISYLRKNSKICQTIELAPLTHVSLCVILVIVIAVSDSNDVLHNISDLTIQYPEGMGEASYDR